MYGYWYVLILDNSHDIWVKIDSLILRYYIFPYVWFILEQEICTWILFYASMYGLLSLWYNFIASMLMCIMIYMFGPLKIAFTRVLFIIANLYSFLCMNLPTMSPNGLLSHTISSQNPCRSPKNGTDLQWYTEDIRPRKLIYRLQR